MLCISVLETLLPFASKNSLHPPVGQKKKKLKTFKKKRTKKSTSWDDSSYILYRIVYLEPRQIKDGGCNVTRLHSISEVLLLT